MAKLENKEIVLIENSIENKNYDPYYDFHKGSKIHELLLPMVKKEFVLIKDIISNNEKLVKVTDLADIGTFIWEKTFGTNINFGFTISYNEKTKEMLFYKNTYKELNLRFVILCPSDEIINERIREDLANQNLEKESLKFNYKEEVSKEEKIDEIEEIEEMESIFEESETDIKEKKEAEETEEDLCTLI